MMASVTRVRRERIPLQASATSSGMEASTITFPCRKTGTPTSSSRAVANLEASSCRGKVTCCRIRLGIGIIRIRKAQGNRIARKNVHPWNRMIRPARSATSDPPSSRGSELPLLSYSYSALVSEDMRKWVSDAKQNRYFGRQCWLQTSKYDQKSLSESPGPGNSASQRENGKLFPIPANHRRPSVLLEMAEDAVSPTIRWSWGFIPKIVGE